MGVDQESLQNTGDDNWSYKAVFGLPWDCEQFIRKAVEAGHPSKLNFSVPKDLQLALEKHLTWNEQTLVEYRMHWCRKWLRRAKELEALEQRDADTRPAHVKAATAGKRILLTAEILSSMQYEDGEVLDLLRVGSPLAGEIPKCSTFQELYKPCMLTMGQLLKEAPTRNQAILSACKSSGNVRVDQQLLFETREEVKKGWAIGPFSEVPDGCVVSRRFPLVQRDKVRMIDDFTISGINDTASSQNKVGNLQPHG